MVWYLRSVRRWESQKDSGDREKKNYQVFCTNFQYISICVNLQHILKTIHHVLVSVLKRKFRSIKSSNTWVAASPFSWQHFYSFQNFQIDKIFVFLCVRKLIMYFQNYQNLKNFQSSQRWQRVQIFENWQKILHKAINEFYEIFRTF